MTADDELRAVLHAHTIDAPDADAVHIGIRTAITKRRKQRQVTQAAGVAIVVGGLAVAIPVFARTGNDHRGTSPVIGVPLSATATTASSTAPPFPVKLPNGSVKYAPTSPVPSATESHTQHLIDSFIGTEDQSNARYDYAVQLTRYWNLDTSTEGYYPAKILAGQILADGKPLPIAPGAVATPTGGPSQVDLAQQAFAAHGYDLTDATTLMGIWHEDVVSDTKTAAGQMLLDGKPLPLP